ncbi:MAG TPA: alpha/beta hydrolase [Bacteroidetes bacterium]|nr:alpha/beta hydrolase [Bacteroidota bacterium]
MDYQIKEEGKFRYIEEGEGDTLMLLHGLFGALSNFRYILDSFKGNFRVVIPILPITEMDIHDASVRGLERYTHEFVQALSLDKFILLGNSLGGHIAQLYALAHPEKVRALILTGSSGLFESAMGSSFPKRGDYEFMKQRTEYTFYDPKTATKELVDEVFEMVNNRGKAFRIISVAKSAMRENLATELHNIKCPVCLIWGKNDNITPPFVAEEFQRLIPHADLFWMDKCGHAPMMEKPEEFNTLLEKFLNKISVSA